MSHIFVSVCKGRTTEIRLLGYWLEINLAKHLAVILAKKKYIGWTIWLSRSLLSIKSVTITITTNLLMQSKAHTITITTNKISIINLLWFLYCSAWSALKKTNKQDRKSIIPQQLNTFKQLHYKAVHCFTQNFLYIVHIKHTRPA